MLASPNPRAYLPAAPPADAHQHQPWRQQAQPPAQYALLDRHRVRVVGTGKPPLLFCNGFGCSQHIWHYLIPSLANHYQLVFFDQIGTGDTDPADYDPRRYATLTGYAHDVVAICRALDLHHTVLVGHSAGATIALLAGIEHPACFSKVVLLAASPCYLNEPGYPGGLDRADIEALLAAMDANYDGWAQLFASQLIGDDNPVSLGYELAESFCRADVGIARQFARLVYLADCRPALPHLPLPTLLLQCTADVAVPPEVGEYLLAHLPQATLVTLPTTGHCPHLSAPGEVLAEMYRFLGAGQAGA